ncbi:MAG: ABC transporter substrate-binding protein [Chloroflexi bacterium]|nr:ABC transporter substrate-binding protein [Chloroflexota bacterium]
MRFWKNRRRGGLLTLVVSMVSLALIAAACSSSEPEPAAPPVTGATAAPAPATSVQVAPVAEIGAGETMAILVANIGNGRFDTWLSDGEDAKFHRIMNIGLVGGSGGSVLVPAATKSWEMSADGMQWVFTANEGVFTDHAGNALGIADAKWTADKVLGNEARRLAETGYYEPRDIADAAQFEKVEFGPGPDQFTVFAASMPRPDVPAFLSEHAQGPQGMLQSKTYTDSQIQPGDLGYEGFEKAPVGTGSMVLTNWVPEQKFEFERFVDFAWHPGNGFADDRRMKFEFINMEVVPEDATRIAALQSGSGDLIEANILMLEGIDNAGGKVVWQNESAYNWVVMVDCWEPDMWCWDKRVRQAMELAVDRPTIVEQLYGQGATIKGWNHVTPNSLGYSPELDPPGYDLAKAKALLAEAGIVDGKMPNGEQVSFKIYTWVAGDTPLLPELSQLFADAYNDDLGMDVEVVVGDASATRQRWNNRELAANMLVRTNEARYDGTSSLDGGYNNKDIGWRAIKDPDLEPWASVTTPIVRKALADINLATRDASFLEAYKVVKDEANFWSGFYTNLPWGIGPDADASTYKPWELVSYITAVWTLEPAK